jgi:NAD(P)-dependent dehydrogenase (short-subunit alcohol dehydrogenase family)
VSGCFLQQDFVIVHWTWTARLTVGSDTVTTNSPRTNMTRFKAAENQYGRIDHVFANAGVSMTTTFLEDDVDENGDLLPPNLKTMNVNLIGCLYTVKLGIHHLRKDSRDSSIVVTASGSSFTRFPTPDYSTPPHSFYHPIRVLLF